MKEALIIESGIEIAHIEWTHVTTCQDFIVYLNGDAVIYGHFRILSDNTIVMNHIFNITMGTWQQIISQIDLYSTLLKAVTKACEKRKEELKTIDV